MAKIIDEFTDLPLSRERKRQLRLKRDNPIAYKEYAKRGFQRYYKKNSEHIIQRTCQERIKKLLNI